MLDNKERVIYCLDVKKDILFLVTLAFILRIIFIPQGAVSFHYDMARDAFEAKQIYQDHHLKILGPPTSTPGLYHGVFYYYLIAPFYALGGGDPRIVAVFLSFINSLVIIPIMLLAKDIFKKRSWMVLAGLLFAVSFEGIQYGPWLSNPAPAVLTVALFFWGLWIWKRGSIKGLYLATLSAALSTQFQFFLVYLFLLIPIFGYTFKIKTKTKAIGLSFILAALGLINFFIAAVKFKTSGDMLSGLFNISTSGFIDFRPQFSELLLNYINRFTELFTFNFFPTNVMLGGLLAFLVVYAIRKQSLLLFFLFSNLPIIVFGGHSNTYVSIGLAVPAVLGTVMLIQKLTKKSKLLGAFIIILITASNIYAIFKYSPMGQLILVIPNDMNLKNELKLVDQTYKLSQGHPFSINTLTLPLWTNTTWAYLYSWYGKEKYGYVPSFTGHDQIGLLGAEVLPKIDKPLERAFFIIEPHIGIPDEVFNLEIGSENSKTDLISETKYEGLTLQFRKPKLNEK